MRYLKGCKVEVLNEQELPSGSWRCAEVVCSNRYYITVRYDMYNTDEVMIEKVGRNLVRPFPPASEHTQNWIPGDVIEVLHNFSWKMATVSKVLKKNHFMVRLVGSSTKFKVHEVNTRPRHSCLDEKWVLVGQGSGDQNDRRCNEMSFVNYHWLPSSQGKAIKRNANSSEGNNPFKNEENICFRGSCIVLPKTLNRGSPYCSQGRIHGGIRKYRLIENDGGCDQVVAGDLYCMPDNRRVDGGNEDCSLVDDGMLSATHQELFRIEDEVAKFSAKRHGGDDPDTSSVGSCSIDNIYPLHSRILAFPADHSSDAESTCQSRDEDMGCLPSSRLKLAEEIHRLELNAYHCTMESLYASGPLSWEQESLITNLRISLHITNDEHLTELRSLISNATSISIR